MPEGTFSQIGNTIKGQFTSGKLEKAKLYFVKDADKLGNEVTVQFNPAEYQITRSLSMGRRKAAGRDQGIHSLQAASGNLATLGLTLYFDTDTDLGGFDTGSLASMVKSVVLPKLRKKPCEVAREIATMLRYNDDAHSPLLVRFIWGKLDFIGMVANSSLSYLMFARDGTPLRAKLQLSIVGEEMRMVHKLKIRTFNSPNRTKERVLTEGDPLWMMAQQEYGDPAMWRTIAQANGILNPRQLGSLRTLKVPSIK